MAEIAINPKQYGAAADGITDDSAAVDSALANGDVVYITDKHYYNKTLNLKWKKVIGRKGAEIVCPSMVVGADTTIEGIKFTANTTRIFMKYYGSSADYIDNT